jgi:hypothetical protein
MINNDPAKNPVTSNWNKVFLNYCDVSKRHPQLHCLRLLLKTSQLRRLKRHLHPHLSSPNPLTFSANPSPAPPQGGSYAGAVDAQLSNGNFYRGRYILDAVYDTLLSTPSFNMASATSLIIKGCSAGGLAVYLHADYVADKVRAVAPAARVVAAPGAGFFLDTPGFDGNYHYRANYQWVFANMNTSGSINSACVAAQQPGEEWRCYCAQYNLPFIKTPLFIDNSLHDAWQAGNVMALPCNPGSCKDNATEAAVVSYLKGFRMTMINALAPVVSSAKHGGFLQSCFVHVVEDVDSSYDNVMVANGVGVKANQWETLLAWWTGNKNFAGLAVDGDLGSNPTC